MLGYLSEKAEKDPFFVLDHLPDKVKNKPFLLPDHLPGKVENEPFFCAGYRAPDGPPVIPKDK